MEKITLKEYQDYNESDILSLYKSVYWSLYVKEPEKLRRAYEHSLFALAAYQEKQLVGIVRVVGDGVSIIFIQDLLVHPDFQRSGIRKQLMTTILEKYRSVRQKALMTDNMPAQKAFYRSVGLVPIEETKGVCFVKYTV